MQKKTGVLLIQLGTPDSPSTGDVARYLGEFLNDPRVIDLPWLVRKILVNGIIVPFRSPKSAKIYRELWSLGQGASPLLTHTLATRDALAERFKNEDVTIEVAMRYRHPCLKDTLERMRKANYSRLIIIPLFPQYASASSGSAIERVLDIIRGWWVIPELHVVNQFFEESAFIEAVCDQARPYPLDDYDHILFSYHGLPERQVDKVYTEGLCSDRDCEHTFTSENQFCYKAACYETSRLLAQKLDLGEDRYTTCFQSRLNGKWIEPFADGVITSWAERGAKRLLVFSPAFVADCLETLIEIGVEYQALFEEKGGETIQLVPSTNAHPRFIDCLESLVRERS
jgi:protoporphyrin/coproporphyrin ferrochelatase